MSKSLVTARSRRAPPVFVCRKCLKRAERGKDVKKALKAGLKARLSHAAVKPPKLVMTSCFGLCPKRAVVVASAATLRRGEYLLLTDGSGVGDAVELLMGSVE